MMESRQNINPFPGLRPFETEEYRLFFGREGQSDELISKLQRSRFLAVVGTSGSGKSSLIRAGLLPALYGGMMAEAGSGWRIAVMRPGGDPFGNLAKELARNGVLSEAGGGLPENEAVLMIEATLRSSSLGLVDLAREGQLGAYEKLLVVVDQFEELFRFRAARPKRSTADEAAAFVKLLLEASKQKEFSLYVVLTMRSDFLGDCAQFQGLPEAINDGQYLIPRMTRDERRFAVTGPVGVTRCRITEPLVNRLLNDVGDNPDQLPILQHALMRTWDRWAVSRRNGEPIGVEHYEAIGTVSEALSLHADEAFNELPDERSRQIAAILFKALSERGTDNREVRRPTRLSAICEMANASTEMEKVVAVIDVFRAPNRSFLMPPAGVTLQPETVIDISHESLIRNWQRLKDWVNEEAQSARIYRRLAEAAVLHGDNKEALLKDPALQIAFNWYEGSHVNQAWAERYHPEFELAIEYLEESRAAREAELAAQEAQRQQQLARERRELEMAQRYAEEQGRAAQRLKRLSFALVILSVLALGAAGGAVYLYARAKQSENQARINEQEARRQSERAEIATKLAKDSSEQERFAKDEALKQRQLALMRAHQAEESQRRAVEEKTRADNHARKAATLAKEAIGAKEALKLEFDRAEELRKVADEQRKAAEKAKDDIIAEQKKTTEVQLANRLFREASADSKTGNDGRNNAIRKFTDAAQAFEKIKDNSAVAATHVEIAEILLLSDDAEDLRAAFQRFERAAELFEKENDYNSAAFLAVRIGEFLANPYNLSKLRQLDEISSNDIKGEVIEVFEAAIDFYKKANNNEGIIAALTRMGEIAEGSTVEGQRDIDFFEKTLPLFDKKDRNKISAMLIRIGQAYKKKQGQDARATEYFERAIKIHQDAGDLPAAADTLVSLGFPNLYVPELSALQTMDKYAQRVERLWPSDSGDKNLMDRADALRKLGENYLRVCEKFRSTRYLQACDFAMPKALDYSERARTLYKQANNPVGQARSLANIGDVYRVFGVPSSPEGRDEEKNHARARGIYAEALSFFRQQSEPKTEGRVIPEIVSPGDTRLMADTLENLGRLMEKNNTDQALKYYEEARDIFLLLRDRRREKDVQELIDTLKKRMAETPSAPATPKASPSP